MQFFLGFIGLAIFFDLVWNDGDGIKGIIRAIRGKDKTKLSASPGCSGLLPVKIKYGTLRN